MLNASSAFWKEDENYYSMSDDINSDGNSEIPSVSVSSWIIKNKRKESDGKRMYKSKEIYSQRYTNNLTI